MLTYVEPPGFVKSVGGTAGDGAAALTINVSHLAASVSIFFFCFSLSFSAPRFFSFLCPSLSNTSSTLNSVLQDASVHREGGLNNYIDKEKKIDPSGRITSPALIPLSCGLWISSFNSSCVLLMLR